MRFPRFIERLTERQTYRYEADITVGDRVSRIRLIGISAPRNEMGQTAAELEARIKALETGKRILFIDSHIRRPNSGYESQIGLAQILLGSARVRDILRRTEIGTFWKIPGGSAETPANELLESQRMKQFLAGLGVGQFHMIFVHIPRGTWRRPKWFPK